MVSSRSHSVLHQCGSSASRKAAKLHVTRPYVHRSLRALACRRAEPRRRTQQVLTLSSRGGGGPFDRRSDVDKKRSEEAGAPVLAALVPAFLAIMAASFLGKFVFSIVTGVVGLGVFLVVGITATTVLLPATLLIGGILTVAAILGSLSVGGVLSLGIVGFLASRNRKKKLAATPSRPFVNSEAEELERRRREERAEIESARVQREELLDFDRRLDTRNRQ